MPPPKFSLFSKVQVTNPAIDPLREGLVMSLEVNIGKRGNLLEIGPENASQVSQHTSVIFSLSFPYNTCDFVVFSCPQDDGVFWSRLCYPVQY